MKFKNQKVHVPLFYIMVQNKLQNSKKINIKPYSINKECKNIRNAQIDFMNYA